VNPAADAGIARRNRTLAISCTSEHCIATNPSDMCVAMAALEAKIHVQGPKGPRAIAFGDFHLLPGSTATSRNRPRAGRPYSPTSRFRRQSPEGKQLYLKLRDRASYEFALASAAVVLTISSDKITRARIALGGVGTKPCGRRKRKLHDPKAEPMRLSAKPQKPRCDVPSLRVERFQIELAKRS